MLRGVLACTLLLPELGMAAVNFDRDIRPILSDTCFTCHGPDQKQRMAGLRLDVKEDAYRVIVPGDSGKSRLYQRISAADAAKRMPPAFSGRRLTAQQVELIKQWIDQGAGWQIHWSYIPPQRPPLPAVKDKRWVRNPIDAFVLARLEREGLRPSREADKATLLRRVTFDLTGLPPTQAQLDSFLADHAPDAYEKRVDELLASPRYGERMAMQWLDLARYADTHGYHIDSHRDMWPWRDWVIRAFNRNMPFDEFTTEQLAGDLLPKATLEQKIATGFNRNHMINFEGGAIPEEYQVEYVVDRVEATSTTWLGLTMGCARCHDHKYDPIKQKEFYRFFAFFNTISEKGLDGRRGNAEPVVQIPSDVERRQLDEVTQAIAAKEKLMPKPAGLTQIEAEWEKTAELPAPPRDGVLAHYELEGSFADSSGHYRQGRVVSGDLTFSPGLVGKGADFDGETQIELPDMPAGSLAVWLKPTGRKEMTVIRNAAFEIGFEEAEVLPGLKRGAHLFVRVNGKRLKTRERLILGQPFHLAFNCKAQELYINGKPAEVEVSPDQRSGTAKWEIGKPYKGQMDDLRIFNREFNSAEIAQLAIHEPARATLYFLKRSKDQKDRLLDYYLTYAADEPLRKLYVELKGLRAQKEYWDEIIPTSMVMDSAEKPRETFVLGRGDYRNKGEKVTPGVPSMLPPLPKDAPLNRLTLARWLVDPEHPLTARVAVNRYWQMYFGTGIVKTTEDFGSQGDPPSHPQLLDWLAMEFVRSGWNIKAMQKLIVTSAAYRQSSRVTPELLEKDPENRLLARGPRYRLPAEMVRDNALAASGLLHEQLGGRSVFPYQPKGLWEEIAYGDVYSAQSYTPSHGEDLYRRSMYTFWKRTSPPPSLTTFDAPDREKCTARRAVTNTPLQALVLLNDPTYIEASRALAARMITEAGRDPVKRIRWAFRLATARQPSPQEVNVLRDLAREESAAFEHNPEGARKLLAVGESKPDAKFDPSELAAWTTVASTILNLDETITKE